MTVEWHWDDAFDLPFYTCGVLPTRIIIPTRTPEEYNYAKAHCGVLLHHKWGHQVSVRKRF